MLLCKFLVLAITTGKKINLVICLAGCAVVSVFGSCDYDRKKKSTSRLSGGLCCCVSFWFWQERGSFFVVARKFYYDQYYEQKKSSSPLSGRCVIAIKSGKRKVLVVCLVDA